MHNGDVFEFTFDTAGVQPYFCKFHFFTNDMRGSVTVQ